MPTASKKPAPRVRPNSRSASRTEPEKSNPAKPVLPFVGFDWKGVPQLCQALRSEDFLKFLGSEPLRFDLLAQAPCAGTSPLNRADVERIREAFARYSAAHGRRGWKGKPAEIVQAITLVSRERPFHPVADYLQGLTWDGEPRLDRVSAEVLDVDSRAAGAASALLRKWCIAAVARAFRPGCAIDGVLVLLGEGRTPNDVFFRMLVPPGLYVDVPAESERKAHDPLRRAWVYACEGLADQATGPGASAFAAWLAATDDEVDGFFSIPGECAPRTTVFAATGESLPQTTSPGLAHRLWGIPVGPALNAGKLLEWRDQLWAEAVAEHQKGSAWTLSPAELEQQVDVEQWMAEPDPWAEHIVSFVGETQRLRIEQILEHLAGLLVDDAPGEQRWAPRDRQRVARVIVPLGFVPERTRTGGFRVSYWVRNQPRK